MENDAFKWVSVTEKLPNDKQQVLVCIPRKNNIDVAIATFHQAKEEGRRYGISDMKGNYKITFLPYWSLPCVVLLETVTFWALLPEPKHVS